MVSKLTKDNFSLGTVLYISIFIAIFLAVAAPLMIIAYSQGTSPISLGGFLGEGFLAACIYALTIFSGLWVLRMIHVQMSVFVAVFFLSWIILSITVAPISAPENLKEDFQLSTLNLVVVLAISIILSTLTVFVGSRILKHVLSIALVFGTLNLIAALAFSTSSFALGAEKQNDLDAFLTMSRGDNVLVVSFDGIPGHLVKEILEEDAELRSQFSDFIFFPNAVSNAPATAASITAEQFGERDYHLISQELDGVVKHLGIANSSSNLVPRSWAYGQYARYLVDKSRQFGLGDLSESKSIATRPLAIQALGLQRSLGIPAGESLSFFSRLLGLELKEYLGPEWKATFRASEFDFSALVEGLTASGTSPASELRQLHFVHSHFPVDYDSGCKFRGDDPTWHDSDDFFDSPNQSEDTLKAQTVCVMGSFVELINSLKTIGVYDSTHLVLKSDHGEPTLYFNDYPFNQRINGNELWGFSRYRPLLLVKPINSKSSDLTTKSQLVSLADLAITNCLVLLPESIDTCGRFPGVNLLSDFGSGSVLGDIHIQVPTNAGSTFVFEEHYTVKFPRTEKDLIEALEDLGTLAISD